MARRDADGFDKIRFHPRAILVSRLAQCSPQPQQLGGVVVQLLVVGLRERVVDRRQALVDSSGDQLRFGDERERVRDTELLAYIDMQTEPALRALSRAAAATLEGLGPTPVDAPPTRQEVETEQAADFLDLRRQRHDLHVFAPPHGDDARADSGHQARDRIVALPQRDLHEFVVPGGRLLAAEQTRRDTAVRSAKPRWNWVPRRCSGRPTWRSASSAWSTALCSSQKLSATPACAMCA